jgi:shikimate dehydrogenase
VTPPEGGFRFFVLGDPVAHSLSPVMHSAALAELGIPGTYTARRVDEAGMAAVADEMRSGIAHGANITMPHKRLATTLSDRLSPEAARARSVNTWVVDDGTITGHSTDVHGVRSVMERLPEGPVVILGTGGAAAAALIALDDRPLTVIARRPSAGIEMVETCGVAATVLGWDGEVPRGVVINCTPIGMSGERLPARFIDSATGYFEMVYASGETPAEQAARDAGLAVVGGLELLAAQAEASFELWTGVAPPPALMYRSADKHLKTPHGGAES